MPHLRIEGRADPAAIAGRLPREVHRWGRAVLKTEECWRRADDLALLVEGTVVELGRPLRPVALVTPDADTDTTVVRLWPAVPVERTQAVQRWLCVLAAALVDLGCGRVTATNVPGELRADLGL